MGWVHPAEGELGWPQPMEKGAGVVEAVTVGKGFSGASLSFKRKSSEALRPKGPQEGASGPEG